MISALETAAEMMRSGMNGYFLAGMQGVLIGLVYGIELIIIIEVLVNGKNSRVIKFIKSSLKITESQTMTKDIPGITLTVNYPEELPENIRKYYDVINESDRIVSAFEYGKFHVCMKNEAGELGLFQKNLIKESGDMYLPSFENAPLFIRKPGKIVVIAPCEVKGGIRA